MECAEALDWISVYSDMPADDPQRLEIVSHLEHCESCTEQYRVWSVSEQWDEDMTDWSLRAIDWEEAPVQQFRAEDVMERIYHDNPWFTPVHRRGKRMSPRLRNMFAGVVSFCLAVFLSGLLALAVTADQPNTEPVTGIIPTTIAGDTSSPPFGFIEIDVIEQGVHDPILLQVVPTVPQYWIVLSLFGVSFALLLLNWLARAKK